MFKKMIVGLIAVIVISAVTLVATQPKVLVAFRSEASALFTTTSNTDTQVTQTIQTAAEEPSVIEMNIVASDTLKVSESALLKISFTNEGTSNDLLWSVDRPFATIDEDGYLWALSEGTIVVTAYSAQLQLTATKQINILPNEEVKEDTQEVTPTPAPAPAP
ncbi:MAG TPA: hypothetical protein DEA51_00945, partial [Erysipelotrichaceae bacterium]|nr:hypothetical protein [Erysipelotrichaceae bacterium]